MNLLNLIEDTTTGYDNLRALMQASQSGQDAVLNVGGETVTLDPMETRWMFGKYKAFNKAGRQEEFLNHLADPVKFDQHMKQLRQLIDKQKNFQGSVPGERGVTGDTMPGQVEENQAVEEIAMQNPNNMTAQTRGKLNWENMIKDYMGNKPYTEFEFSGDRPLTVYRTQVYAILKAFGSMKPQNKVNIILNTFGDKMATVEYLDKLRAKGLMPKKVPAYVSPDTEPVPPGQMDLPGMATPKIREADDQKKNSKTTELDGAVNPRVARAMQLARARQSAAGNDTEAMVADFVDQQEKDQAEFNKVKSVNQRQDDLLKQVTAVNQQQDQEINSLDSDNADLQANLQQLQAVNADLAKKLADVGQRRADRQQEPQTPAPSTSTSAEPKATAEPPLQQPATTAQPAPVKKKKTTTRKKSSATKVQRPQKDVSNNVNNVLPFRRPEPAVAQDELSAALQGVDMGDELATGTYGLRENTETLNVGDPVIISGNVEFNGKTGDVVGFGRDQHFVIVDLYNFGKHAFHASNVKYNDYADEEDYVDEGRFKDLDIERQSMTDFQRKERTVGEEEPVGDFRVVRRKDGVVGDLKQHYSSNKAFAHAQALKKKYPSMEVGVRWPTGQINWVGLTREGQRMDKFNIAQPTPGGSNKQREEFLNARDRLFRQMQSASPGEKEAIRLKIAELEGQAQSQGIKIRETDDLNRSGYNAIKSLSDWAEKMNVMRELQKDIALMSDPESKAAVQQRIGDLLKVGIKQGYVKEALNDKAMSVLRSLQQPAQSAPVAVDLNIPEPVSEPAMDLVTVRKRIAQLDELIKMKEMIDKLFVRAQNARGGIYPGLQSDIEDEELYGVPQSDKEYQILKDKYTKDLSALQKFIAMKKAVYREGQEALGESSALVRLKQARQALSQQGVAEDNWDSGEDVTVTQDDQSTTYQYKGNKFVVSGEEAQGEAWWYEPGDTWREADHYNYVYDESKGIDRFYNEDGQNVFNLSATNQSKVEQFVKAKAKDFVSTMVAQPNSIRMHEQDVEEAQTDYQKRRQRERDVDAGKPVARQPKNPQNDYFARRKKEKKYDMAEESQDDRNARIIAGEIEDAMAQGKEEVVKQKIKQLIDVGYTLDKNGKLQRMGMYEDQALQEEQDACYRKVKARYKVWPSAYASGALVQCRKKGADNWGEGGKKK